MKTYNVMGRTTGLASGFMKRLGWKNIKSISLGIGDVIQYHMKDGSTAGLKFLAPGTMGIYWSVIDFQYRAEKLKGENWREFYNEEEFENALATMCDKHDANIGITWDSIDYYLDYMCKK
jgi:hypothetical protein